MADEFVPGSDGTAAQERRTSELARRCQGYVGINGKDVWGDLREYATEIEFEEVANGETDSFEMTLIDEKGKFLEDWMIYQGDEVDAKFQLTNWNTFGDEIWIDCGSFLVDALKIRGFPCEVTLKSVTLPVIGTANTRKWENIRLSKIASDICANIGAELKFYSYMDVIIKSREQSRQTDINFLFSLCKEYGLGMKAYRRTVVIYDRDFQDNTPELEVLNIREFAESFTIDDNEEGTYTGAQCNFKPEGSDNTYVCTYGTRERMIVLNTTADSMAEAMLKTKAAVFDANCEKVKLNIKALGGQAPIYAAATYYFYGLGVYTGKYAVDRVTHTLSGSKTYRLDIECHAVSLEKDRYEQ